MTAAEFALLCKNAGLSAAEIDDWNIGTIIDFVTEKNRAMKKNQSRYTDQEKYQALKKIEPIVEKRYKNGLISVEKYNGFKRAIAAWE